MPLLKEVSHTGVLAWSPMGISTPAGPRPLIAVGGKSLGCMDLELYTYDLGSGSGTMDQLGVVSHPQEGVPFRCLLWDIDTIFPESRNGALVAGMENGCVMIWCVDDILENGAETFGRKTVVPRMTFAAAEWGEEEAASGGPVTCLTLTSNADAHKLTLGTSHGAIRMVAFKETGPEFLVMRSEKPVVIKDLAFSSNSSLRDIMAAVTSDGAIQLWNVAQSKKVMTFVDRQRVDRPLAVPTAVRFHPRDQFKIFVTYDDDTSPAIQIWDVRQRDYPMRELASGHTRGILSLAFCPQDNSIFATAGKDANVVVWVLDDDTPSVLTEVHTHSQAQAVSFSTPRPGLIAVAAVVDTITLHSLGPLNKHGTRYCPSWYLRPYGGHLGFGGRLVSFGKSSSWVTAKTVVTDGDVTRRADSFERAMAHQDWSSYFQHRVAIAEDSKERLMWQIIASSFGNIDRKELLLKALGVSESHVLERCLSVFGMNPIAAMEGRRDSGSLLTKNFAVGCGADESTEKFFADLRGEGTIDASSDTGPTKTMDPAGLFDGAQKPCPPYGSAGLDSGTQGSEGLLQQALSAGNRRLAVAIAMASHREADALLMAAGSNDSELWEQTKNAYLDSRARGAPGLNTFYSLLTAILTDNFDDLVQSSDLSRWEETLAMLVAYALPGGHSAMPSANVPRFSKLACELAERLEKEKADPRSAVVCLVCAGDFHNTIRIWSTTTGTGRTWMDSLQSLVEQVFTFKAATGIQESNALINEKTSRFAEVLANSGRLVSAMRFLAQISSDPTSAILKDRIYFSSPEAMQQAGIAPPTKPFDVFDLPVAPTQVPAQQEQRYPPASMPPGPAGYPITQQSHPVQSSASFMPAHQPVPQPGAFAASHIPPVIPPMSANVSQMRPPVHQSAPQLPMAHPGAPIQKPQPPPSFTPNAWNPSAPSGHPGGNMVPPPVPGGMHHRSSSSHLGSMGMMPPPGGTLPMASSMPSTAPNASTLPVPGMPVPWPIPTGTQQIISSSQSAAQNNTLVQSVSAKMLSGQPMSPEHLQLLDRVIHRCMNGQAVQSDPRLKPEEFQVHFAEMRRQLVAGEIKVEAQNLLIEACKATEAGDYLKATNDISTLTRNHFTRQAKGWIMAFKKAIPRF